MKLKSLIVLLCAGFLLYSFSSKNETIRSNNDSPQYVKSLIQSSDYLKLHINRPMKLGEYTANKTNNTSLIKSVSRDIIFIPNKGQIIDTDGKLRPDILYKASLKGIDLYLTNKGMSFVFYKYVDTPQNLAAGYKETDEIRNPLKDDIDRDRKIRMYRMDLDIVGMNTNFKTLNEEQTTEYFNYYYAHCPDGITNVNGYGKVIYENVYDNIDIVFHSNTKGLKYDFIVKPDGDVSDIKLKYKNEDEVYITKEGKIRALNPFGEVETDVLYTYQSDGNVVESNYIKDTDGTIRVITGEYDRTKDLIIDPFIGATYYGGNYWDIGFSMTTDGNDNILITGWTSSTNFPVQNPGGGAYYQGSIGGEDDTFILKLNSNGVRQWATYYGGSTYGGGHSITTDLNNNILITGQASSTNLPVYNPGGGAYFQGVMGGSYDAFILKFNSNGIRMWATYYGGSYGDVGFSITADASNNIIVTGIASSTNFPIQNPGGGTYYQDSIAGLEDAFVLKFNSNGVRLWATYYGGDETDWGYSVTTDGSNNILITGRTHSNNFPLLNPGNGAYFQNTNAGNEDAFILKFSSNGVRQWSTYYGGNNAEEGNSLTIDGNNSILITGYTTSTDFPLQNPGSGAYFQSSKAGEHDVYILKFNSNGVRQWATYYGGNDWDEGQSITVDGNDNILIAGNTESTTLPLQNPGGGAYFQSAYGGISDAFILKFNSVGVRQWATYYGGDSGDIGYSITTGVNNNILVTGGTASLDFPLYDPGGSAYYQSTFGGSLIDAFILGFTPSGVIGICTISTSVPNNYALYQNYPNPFNPTTNIKFDIPKSSHVKLIVYDILGKEVTTLVNEKLSAGSYEVDWVGNEYPGGVYFYQLKTGGFTEVKKMVLVK